MSTARLKQHKIKLIVFLVAALTIPAGIVSAATLSVSFEQTPLFQDFEVAPGSYVARSVVVTNNGSDTETVYTSVENATSTGLADMMEISINSTSTIYYATSTFSSLFGETDPIVLGSLAPGESRTYSYVAGLPSAATNVYQGLSLGFDLVVGFEGGDSVTDSGGSSGGGGGGSGGGSNSGTEPTTPPGIVAGASDSRSPDPVGAMGQVKDYIKGLVLGDSDTVPDQTTVTDTSSTEVVDGVNGTTTVEPASASCTFWWLFLLAVISTLWSVLDDFVMADRRVWLVRNLVFGAVYGLSLWLGSRLGLLESWWWAWFGLWVLFVAADHMGHQQIINWSGKLRHVFYTVTAALLMILSLLIDLPCQWWPFFLIAVVSTIVLIFFPDQAE